MVRVQDCQCLVRYQPKQSWSGPRPWPWIRDCQCLSAFQAVDTHIYTVFYTVLYRHKLYSLDKMAIGTRCLRPWKTLFNEWLPPLMLRNAEPSHFAVGLTCVCEHPISGGGCPPSRTSGNVVWDWSSLVTSNPWWVSCVILEKDPETVFKSSRPKLLLVKRPNKTKVSAKSRP